MIEVLEADRVRVYVSNRLPEATSVHWHGIRLPAGMDGLSGLTQKEIAPGETFRYEFIFPHAGTFMYHPHYDEMTQMAMGLMGMIVPANSIPMLGKEGPFGYIDMGGMFTILKVRESIATYDDPGWFQHPAGSIARPATPEELKADDIEPPAEPRLSGTMTPTQGREDTGTDHAGH